MNLLVTGQPGCGKTTLIERLAAALGPRAGGFLTREIREGGRREGFEIVTLDGRRGILAHTTIASSVRVGRYGVDLAELERLGVAAVREALQAGLIVVIDEIGKMELGSPAFRQAVIEALDSPLTVLATIHAHPHPFTDAIKRRHDVRLFELTRANRAPVERTISALLEL